MHNFYICFHCCSTAAGLSAPFPTLSLSPLFRLLPIHNTTNSDKLCCTSAPTVKHRLCGSTHIHIYIREERAARGPATTSQRNAIQNNTYITIFTTDGGGCSAVYLKESSLLFSSRPKNNNNNNNDIYTYIFHYYFKPIHSLDGFFQLFPLSSSSPPLFIHLTLSLCPPTKAPAPRRQAAMKTSLSEQRRRVLTTTTPTNLRLMRAKQSKAKQSKAKQSKAKQNKTKQQSQPTQRSALVHHSCKDRDDSHCKQRKQTHTFTFTFTLAGHFRHMPKVGPTHKNTQPTVSMHIIITLALDSLQTWTLIWLSECVCLLCLAVLGLLLCSGEMVGRSCLSFIHLFCHGAKQSKAKQRKEKKRKQGRKTVAATVQKEAGRALFFFFFFFFWFGLFVSFSAE